jgi:hypothetical protein
MKARSLWITAVVLTAIAIFGLFPASFALATTRGFQSAQPLTSAASVAFRDPCSLQNPLFLPVLKIGLYTTATPLPPKTPTPPVLPNFSHVYVLVMENKEITSVIGSPNAPYLNCLANNFGLATNYTGVTHPSQPNYLALFSGSTQGVTDNLVHNLAGQNLADQLEAKQKTWKVYAQNYPLNCALDESVTGGPDDPSGNYVRKHNPAISFTNISTDSVRCANISDFSHFDPAAADFELIVPNMCNATHDCPVATGDNFLKGFVPTILNSSAWDQNSVLFIIYDEGATNIGGGGKIVAAVISNRVPKGTTSATAHDHYSLLRTIEDAWGLGRLNNAATANTMVEFFP